MKDNQDELFVVVNKKDRIICYRTRFDCHHNKQLIHRAIGVVIFNKQGQILLQKRSKNKDTNPGFYTLSTSGHVGKGETYEQSAQRELFEEIGIHSPLKRKGKFILESDVETEMDCLFSTIYNGPFYPNKEEVDELKFVSIDQLNKMKSKLTPFAAASLRKLGLLQM